MGMHGYACSRCMCVEQEAVPTVNEPADTPEPQASALQLHACLQYLSTRLAPPESCRKLPNGTLLPSIFVGGQKLCAALRHLADMALAAEQNRCASLEHCSICISKKWCL